MSYFLAPGTLIEGATVELGGEEAQHLLKSRRMRAGERFALQGTDGRRHWAELVDADRRSARARVLGAAPIPPDPDVTVRLWLAAVKDKATEWVVQKATELGVAELHVFRAEHSPVALKELEAPRMLERWRKIAIEACKQCDRQHPPKLAVWPDLAVLLAAGQDAGIAWLLDADGKPAPRASLSAREVTVLVGPEGGLSAEEQDAAVRGGFARVKLGPLTLRTVALV
jgi:16S rRNA (uracil1498-N3)-methyltransferase